MFTALRTVAFLTVAAIFCLAQTAPTTSLFGVVADPSGATIASATVALTSRATRLNRQTTSGADGKYRFSLIPAGEYELDVTAAGFRSFLQTGIVLNVDVAATVNVGLSVGALADQVTVSEDALMINTQSGTLTQIINARYIEELPLNGRNAATLVRMVPGAVTGVGTTTAGYANTGETQAISINGTRGNEINYKLDGATHIDNITNLNAIYPNPDALAEFSVQTSNYSAQYGQSAGGVVNVVTKSGTNQLHGSGFEFLRNGNLNARNFFALQHDNLKRNQFGGAIGGPILKNKLFWFASYQGTTVNNTSFTNTATVPDAKQRSGDFSGLMKAVVDPLTGKQFPGNAIPADRISPIARNLLTKVPFSTAVSGLLFYARPDQTRAHQGIAKVDYNRANHLVSGSFFAVNYNDPGWDGGGTLLTTRIGQFQTTRDIKGQDIWTITPSVVNTFIASGLFLDSYNTKRSPFTIQDFGNIAIAHPGADASELELSVTGYGGWGSVTNSPPGQWLRRNIELSDTIHLVTGRHQALFGAQFTPYIVFDSSTKFQQSGGFTFSGQTTGNGLADLLLGKVSTFVQSAGKFKKTRGQEFNLFAEDNIRVTDKLTVNLGVRWDPFLPYYDDLNQVTGLQSGYQSQRFPLAPPGLIFPGDPGFPRAGMNTNWNNVAPRIGFAWTPRGSAHPTTIRGGYGIFYVLPFPRLYNNFVENAPFSPSVTLTGVDLADPYGSAGVKNPFPPYAPLPLGKDSTFVRPTAVAFFQKDWRVGYSQAWSLTVEQQLAANYLLRVAYVANKGTHLQSFQELNPAIYGPGATLRTTDARRPLAPNFASVKELVDNANSTYHSLQVTVEKRFSRDFSFLAFYTWSKAIDLESANNQFTISNPNPFDPAFNRGLADFDVPHNFRLTGIYDLPRLTGQKNWVQRVLGGWRVSEIIDWRSGTPFGLQSGIDNSFSGVGQDRADLFGNPRLPADRPLAQVIQKYFDTSVLKVNAPGTFGNSPRNFLRNQSLLNTDASLEKSFSVRERVRIQLRCDAFNVFNNTHLNQPGSNVSAASTFGVVISAGEPRILQLGARIIF